MASPRPGERARDEARGRGGPRYGGTHWQAADARGPDERYGHTRADDTQLEASGADDQDPREASFAGPQRPVAGGNQIGVGRVTQSGARGKYRGKRLK
jgi:hypothetical protein